MTATVFTHVGKSFGQVRAVDDLSLTLHPGETVALLGPNGAGKSTTLDLLLGLRVPDSGTVEVFGTTPRRAIAEGRVGAVLQSGGLMEEVTVRELVRLACDLHPRAHPVAEVMAAAGLESIADRKVDKLSGGQEQRVRFALATAGASDLLILDEPTTGMDVSARQAFWEAMRGQVKQGRTVLFATHYLEEADAVADRVLVLQGGRLVADGTAAEMPGAMTGLDAAAAVRAALPQVRVVIVTTFGRPGYLRRAMEAGADAFLVKDAPAGQLAEAVRRVLRGEKVIDPVLAAAALSEGADPLTPRERDVLRAAADGSLNADIARRLHLSEGTVRNYLSTAIQKTAARNRAEAVRIALERGWL
ncbi:ATP-binding cassette domain-containing protein [Actinacidiphila glaucinigra]|uniref:ATP-binding cassette domain-containing protein n=1 Tax=Actinacidiphila glaucinigra TaxID=235986 RepID=UPI00367D18E1